MISQEYQAYLVSKGVTGKDLEDQLRVVYDFALFQTVEESKGILPEGIIKVVEQFARKLIADGRNTEENFISLARYGYWLGQHKLFVAWLELMDCGNAMQVLAEKVADQHGTDVRDQIFVEPFPVLGANETERCAFTLRVLDRMDVALSREERQAAWFEVQHGIPQEEWREGESADKELFRKLGSIDAFLDKKKEERDEMLTRLHDENKLWYTVEITTEVLEFVKANPEIEAGRRAGDKIFITKIPYHADRYLHEADPEVKRTLACHCPLVREAILQGKILSEENCSCSLGHASHYLAGLDVEVKGEVLESAVKGDSRCRFVFTIV